jgi:hypothetical protein
MSMAAQTTRELGQGNHHDPTGRAAQGSGAAMAASLIVGWTTPGGRAGPHFAASESPSYIGRAVAALAADPDVGRWSGTALTPGQLARAYGFTDADGR